MKINRYRQDGDISYTLGLTVTLEMLAAAPELVKRIFVSSLLEASDNLKQLYELAKQHKIAIEQNDKAFNILSPKVNCQVIGEFSKIFKRLDEKSSHVLLVNPSEAGHVGTILRSSAAFGVPNVAIVRPAADVYAPKAVRGSMGAFFNVNFEYFDSIEDYRKRFANHTLYAFMLGAKNILKNAQLKAPYSLVFGNEATGLPEEFASFCEPVRIPHSKNIDSLSLPIAASIAIYAATTNNWN